jgi:hypothetical protein
MSSGYRHHVPGRLRVRTERIKNRPAAASAVEQLMATVAGVQRAQATALTGSVTVHYDAAATTAVTVLSVLHAHGYIQDCSLPEWRTAQRNPAGGELAARIASRVASALAEKALERAVATLIAAAL